MNVIDKAEAAWNEYIYRDIPVLCKRAFIDGFIQGFMAGQKEIKKYISDNQEDDE